MEVGPGKGSTYVAQGRQLVPVYLLDEKDCVIREPGRVNEREGIGRMLAERGLSLRGVMVTHMHYDHHENTSYLKEKYGAICWMPRQDAELCRDRVALRNHLYTFSPDLLATERRLRDLICAVECPVLPEQTKVSFAGADFEIVHTPGHSPSHMSIVTPEGVCFVGEVLV